ncbi:aminotransferase-like domain-containing protein [Aspergillus affinis]|uniref:aminotransferase-like domain-containing protein n=1 Tax=Aspergillus affinis TaxID=1070780 RepID=UPI0022FEDA25|nr:PLP-dependent transferase [Aspergillus affinis]KAI9037499.1 PLP-dependent transferase [Aspergillus affinis]
MGSIAINTTVDPTTLFSKRVQQYEPGAIRSLLPLEALPGMISLVAGKPNPETFPFAEISILLKGSDGHRIVLEEDQLSEALQYGLPGGNPELIMWFEELQRRVHGIRDHQGWACCIGNGSQELIHRAFQVFTDFGDPVLIETYICTILPPSFPIMADYFTGQRIRVAGFLRADGHQLSEVQSDAKGLNPVDLERVLSAWPGKRRPRVLYTVPTGSNPTGQSCSEIRKAQILRLAKQFNFMIFEDDAYGFLNFDQPSYRARSYLALENEINGETGRVLRFDSLSKIVSSGMRLGILTGPLPAVQKVIRITENINLQPSSTTQMLALTLFNHWGHAGFLQHCERAANFYRQRRNVFAAAAEKYLHGRATWETPSAGMFFWLTLLLPPGQDSFEILSRQGKENGILAIPGVAFLPNQRSSCQLRVSYSLLPEEKMFEACQRIAKLVDNAWRFEILM